MFVLVLYVGVSRGVMSHEEMFCLYSRCAAFPKEHRTVLSTEGEQIETKHIFKS